LSRGAVALPDFTPTPNPNLYQPIKIKPTVIIIAGCFSYQYAEQFYAREKLPRWFEILSSEIQVQ
jgi:hypothetical protein